MINHFKKVVCCDCKKTVYRVKNSFGSQRCADCINKRKQELVNKRNHNEQ